MKKRFAAGVVGAAVIASVLSVNAWGAINASPENTIDYRKNIMKAMDAQAAAIGQILAQMMPADNLQGHFEALLISARQAKVAFKEHVEGGDAKPEIWTNWADFEAKLNRMESGALKAIEAAKNGSDTNFIGEFAVDAMNCKECHDVYRAKN